MTDYGFTNNFLETGFISVDYQMAETGNTVLMKTILENVQSDDSLCINNETDRKEIIRFLCEDGEEWFADVKKIRNRDGKNCLDLGFELK